MLTKLILKQNYFTFDNKFFTQHEGLAMGSPLSGLLADVFLNYYENNFLFVNDNKYFDNILLYKRYVDDTFVIFNGTTRQIENLKNYMNSINKNIQFTLEYEENNRLNFLDLTIIKKTDKFQYKIYRKPTDTDVTICADSFHPYPQKMAVFHSLIHRLINVPLEAEDYNEELNTIKYTATRNGYKSSIVDSILKKQLNKRNNPVSIVNNDNMKYISAEFTNIVPWLLKKEFKKVNYNVTFRTSNSLIKNFRLLNKTPLEKRSGVYKITCDGCNSFYIGQTGRGFYERYKEHLPKSNGKQNNSNYARHLVDTKHNYTDFSSNFKPLHFCSKGRLMNALEEFEIYKAFKNSPNEILNNKLDFDSHYLYDTALHNLNKYINK